MKKIFDMGNIKQLKYSFIVGGLWTAWIALWFYLDFFLLHLKNVGIDREIWSLHYFLSVFILYSISYPPQNSHNTIRSLLYLITVCFLQFINVFILREIFFRYLAPIGSLGPIEPAPRSGLYPALYLVLNFVIVWKAKYVQLCFWKKFKSTLALSVQQEALMKINQKKTLLFVVAGVVLLNLSGYFFDEDLIYLIFTVTQIVFSVGYWLYVSENRKWIDRFIDFVAILALNSVSLLLHYYMWLYIIVTTNTFPLFAFMVELLHVYVYYTFFSRTYLADFALYLHKSPIRLNVYPKQIEKTQIRCPKCNYTIDQVDPSMIEAKTKIFCPGCGEKIMKYELFEPSEAEVLAKHEAILQKLDEKSELSPHYP